MSGYPCSSPECDQAATWAVLSEHRREGPRSEWGIWNYATSLACDAHKDAAENEAVARDKDYSLIPVPLNA